MGTFIESKILIIILWLHLLKALLQSASKLMTALGLSGLSVFLRMKSINLIKAWEHEEPGTANWFGS